MSVPNRRTILLGLAGASASSVALAVPTIAAVQAGRATSAAAALTEPKGERISRLMEELSDALSGTSFRAIIDPADAPDPQIYMRNRRLAHAGEELIGALGLHERPSAANAQALAVHLARREAKRLGHGMHVNFYDSGSILIAASSGAGVTASHSHGVARPGIEPA